MPIKANRRLAREETMPTYSIDFKDLHDRRIEIEAENLESALEIFSSKGTMIQFESDVLDGLREEIEPLHVTEFDEEKDDEGEEQSSWYFDKEKNKWVQIS
jgi:hypothetical protein